MHLDDTQIRQALYR